MTGGETVSREFIMPRGLLLMTLKLPGPGREQTPPSLSCPELDLALSSPTK
jgi:hypothetical protein